MLPFPVSEAGRPGEIGETDHDIRVVVFMETLWQQRSSGFPPGIADLGTNVDHYIHPASSSDMDEDTEIQKG